MKALTCEIEVYACILEYIWLSTDGRSSTSSTLQSLHSQRVPWGCSFALEHIEEGIYLQFCTWAHLFCTWATWRRYLLANLFDSYALSQYEGPIVLILVIGFLSNYVKMTLPFTWSLCFSFSYGVVTNQIEAKTWNSHSEYLSTSLCYISSFLGYWNI